MHGYVCAFYQVNYGTGGPCQHIAGPALDAYVASQVLQAVAPAAVEVAMAAAAHAEDERAMLDKLWRQRLERARYAADRARRQYQLAEPENRLVTRQLEADWEAALAEGAGWKRTTSGSPRNTPRPSAQQNARRSRPWPLISPKSGALRLPARPTARSCCASSSRTSPSPPPGTASWSTSPSPGRRTPDRGASRPPRRPPGPAVVLPCPPRPRHRARRAGRTNQQIADALNAEGFRPPKRTSRFTGQQVRTLISQRGIRSQRKGRPAVLTSLPPGEWSVPGLSAELGMPTASIYNWIYRGWITARHAPGTRNWIITADEEQMRQLRERRARPPGFYTRARWAQPHQEPDQEQGTQL